MGVPAFYRWLSEKYGKIVVDCLEEHATVVDGVKIPLDLKQPNPNNIEFDNLYIDMNGIIHPCAHPENAPQPETEEDMYINIFKYVDRLFAAIRPRRLLYMAIDGVAPRAKMNQQRARRFKTAQEERHKKEMMDKIIEEMKDMGRKDIPPEKDSWDSNVITPGTEFMGKLSKYLQYYVYHRQNTDPAWRDIRVVISDASVPGEGEHKLMAFVRQERAQPNYDPNIRHVLHGLDADLIMLGLATHEANFSILREQVYFGRQGSTKHAVAAQDLPQNEDNTPAVIEPGEEFLHKPLQFLHIPVLREYLQWEFQEFETTLPFPYDFERVVDDFVFMCFFVGNDFLPHLPALDIRDGAIDFLIAVYKRLLPALGGYLTDTGDVNLSRVDVLLAEVGKVEDEVLRRKRDKEQRAKWRKEQQKFLGKRNRDRDGLDKQAAKKYVADATALAPDHSSQYLKQRSVQASEEANALAAKRLREQLVGIPPSEALVADTPEADRNKSSEAAKASGDEKATGTTEMEKDVWDNPEDNGDRSEAAVDDEDGESEDVPMTDNVPAITAPASILGDAPEAVPQLQAPQGDTKELIGRRLKEMQDNELDGYRENTVDNVRLGEAGWKERYYADKLKLEDFEKGGGKETLIRTYVEGLCWVMLYYYKGCPSWNWFYPFHYAPFASDLVNIDRFNIEFEESEPFRPFEQLMAVLPGRSAHALPKPCRWLMNDEESPIIDFYPVEVPLDPNGKSLPWLFVVLLPFIEESRLLDAMRPCEAEFSEEEHHRNRRHGHELLFIGPSDPIVNLAKGKSEHEGVELDGSETNGFSGTVRMWARRCEIGGTVQAPRLPRDALEDVHNNAVHVFNFKLPPKLPHICRFLPGTKPYQPTLLPQDLYPKVPRLGRDSANMVELAQPGNRMIRHALGISNSQFGQQYQHRNNTPTGWRSWGTLEPTPKRHHFDPHGGGGILSTPEGQYQNGSARQPHFSHGPPRGPRGVPGPPMRHSTAPSQYHHPRGSYNEKRPYDNDRRQGGYGGRGGDRGYDSHYSRSSGEGGDRGSRQVHGGRGPPPPRGFQGRRDDPHRYSQRSTPVTGGSGSRRDDFSSNSGANAGSNYQQHQRYQQPPPHSSRHFSHRPQEASGNTAPAAADSGNDLLQSLRAGLRSMVDQRSPHGVPGPPHPGRGSFSHAQHMQQHPSSQGRGGRSQNYPQHRRT